MFISMVLCVHTYCVYFSSVVSRGCIYRHNAVLTCVELCLYICCCVESGVFTGAVFCLHLCRVYRSSIVLTYVVLCLHAQCCVYRCSVLFTGLLIQCGVVLTGMVLCLQVWCLQVWCCVYRCGVVFTSVVFTGVVLCLQVWCCVYMCGVVFTGVVLCLQVWCCVYRCVVFTGVVLCLQVWCCVYRCVVLCLQVWCCVYRCGAVRRQRCGLARHEHMPCVCAGRDNSGHESTVLVQLLLQLLLQGLPPPLRRQRPVNSTVRLTVVVGDDVMVSIASCRCPFMRHLDR